MIININKEWRLTTDNLQWRLEHKALKIKANNPKLDGKPAKTWKQVSYHRDIWGAVRDMMRRQVCGIEGEYPLGAMDELCRSLHRSETNIEKAIEEVKKELLNET